MELVERICLLKLYLRYTNLVMNVVWIPHHQELPQIFERLNSQLASIGTAYKQQSFIAKNLPSVVSIIISLNLAVNFICICHKKPIWHVATVGQTVTPTNGFYYVPFLQSIKALLKNSSTLINQLLYLGYVWCTPKS